MSFVVTFHSLALLRQPVLAEGAAECWEPPADVYETATEVVIELELPDTRPRDVCIVRKPEELVIEGTKRSSVPHGAATIERFFRVERTSGPFRRLIRLPVNVDRDGGSARFRNGLLTIRLPKTER